jgi:septum formation inhibitor MinC
MSGLFRRNRSTRDDAAAETGVEPVVSESEPGGVPAAAPHEESGHPPVAEQIRDVPAGVDPDEILDDRPTSRRRSKLRNRVRLLHKIRELLLRDLGGLVHEIHRMAEVSGDRARHEALVHTKLERLDRVEHELRDLHELLGKPQGPAVLRVPGVGGTCPGCGELHGSDARFCWNCGMPLTPGAERRLRAMEAPAERSRRGLFGRRRAKEEEATSAAGAEDQAAGQDGSDAANPSSSGGDDDGSVAPDEQPTVAEEPVRSGDRRA